MCPHWHHFKRPVVWTLHDSWAFTGGCHIPGDCQSYRGEMWPLPQLGSKHAWDLSRWIWNRKDKFWRDDHLTIVTPSQWLADCARSSSLLKQRRIEVIHNGLDLNQYRPVEKHEARAILGLPQERKLVLFSAMNATYDSNKGFRYLEAALRQLAEAGWHDRMELIVVGQSTPSTPVNTGVPHRFLGVLRDEISMRLVYSAADVTVLASAQENLPNSIMESFACGTPVVAYNVGGIPHLVEHRTTAILPNHFQLMICQPACCLHYPMRFVGAGCPTGRETRSSGSSTLSISHNNTWRSMSNSSAKTEKPKDQYHHGGTEWREYTGSLSPERHPTKPMKILNSSLLMAVRQTGRWTSCAL